MLSWKPKLSGATFCAPACGRGCTKAEYDRAAMNARALAQRLGAGWSTRVWENLGWHYSVQSPCRRIRVHPNVYWKTGKPESYCAFLGEKDGSGGKWAEHGKTPETAIRNVVRAANTREMVLVSEVVIVP